MFWGQRMYFLGQLMVQEEVEQENIVITQAQARWGLLTSGQPRCSRVQSTHSKQSQPLSSRLVESHLARSVLKYH